MSTRREMLLTGAAALGGAAMLYGRNARASQIDADGTAWEKSYAGDPERPIAEPGLPGQHYTPVITPSGSSLPWKVGDGVKVYHLTAEEVWHDFAPNLKARCWGYNGQVHGPTIEAVEGDRIRIYVTNKL